MAGAAIRAADIIALLICFMIGNGSVKQLYELEICDVAARNSSLEILERKGHVG